jgi:putative spermidine/putrescine transport system substrate-binding protein
MIARIPLILALVLVAAAAAFYWYMRPLPVLTVTSWAGAYGRAQAAAQMRPYAAGHRADVHIAQWEGDLGDLKGDVVDFELPKAVEACHRGILEKIDPATLPDRDDFVPGAIGACWVGNNVYSQVIITGKFPGAQPSTLADFFDTVKFPGKRAIRRGSGKYNLEMALLADGVTPKAVYVTLATEDGLQRALAKLGSLGANLVWYSSDSEALNLIQSGAASFATALNGQIFDAAQHGAQGNQSPNVIWDHQLYEFDAFGIPAGNSKKDLAMDYIRFATGPAPLAGVAGWVPYGPARRSAQPLVGKNPATGADMKPFLPTSHWATAFAVDDEWWRINAQQVDTAWRNWLMAAH